MRSIMLATCLTATISTACSAQSSDRAGAAAPVAPRADHHQHLFSPAIATLLSTDSNRFQPLTARDIADRGLWVYPR